MRSPTSAIVVRIIVAFGIDVSSYAWRCRITRPIRLCHALMQRHSNKISCLRFWPLWNISWISLVRIITSRRTCCNYYPNVIAYYHCGKWVSQQIGNHYPFGRNNHLTYLPRFSSDQRAQGKSFSQTRSHKLRVFLYFPTKSTFFALSCSKICLCTKKAVTLHSK